MCEVSSEEFCVVRGDVACTTACAFKKELNPGSLWMKTAII